MNERSGSGKIWGSVEKALDVVIRSHSADSDGVQEPFLNESDGQRAPAISQVSFWIKAYIRFLLIKAQRFLALDIVRLQNQYFFLV